MYFGYTQVCLTTPTKEDGINLSGTLIFIYMEKNQLHLQPPHEILHFKKSCNLTG